MPIIRDSAPLEAVLLTGQTVRQLLRVELSGVNCYLVIEIDEVFSASQAAIVTDVVAVPVTLRIM